MPGRPNNSSPGARFEPALRPGNRDAPEPPQTAEQALNTAFSSWGAPIDAVDQAVQFDGEVRPYTAQDDNLSEFYDTGLRQSHSVALSRGGSSYDVRMSLSRMEDGYIIPASNLDRTTMNLRGAGEIGNLYMDGKINYTIEEADFRPELSDNPANPMLSLTFMPTTLNVNTLDPHRDEQGNHRAWSTSPFRPNPYWGMREFKRDDEQRRVQGFALARYEFTPNISLQARLGTDWYVIDDTFAEPSGTPWFQDGRVSESTTRRREDNVDLLFQFDRGLTENVGLDATLGGNVRYTTSEGVSANGSRIVVPGLLTLTNTQEDRRGVGFNFSEQQTNSLFGTARFDYQDYVYLELTGRNDWSSTLPEGNNSYFYPSISSSFIFTEVFELPEVLSSGTVRASLARVGGDTDPYRLNLNYGVVGSHPARTDGSTARGNILGTEIPPSICSPERRKRSNWAPTSSFSTTGSGWTSPGTGRTPSTRFWASGFRTRPASPTASSTRATSAIRASRCSSTGRSTRDRTSAGARAETSRATKTRSSSSPRACSPSASARAARSTPSSRRGPTSRTGRSWG